MSKSRFTPLTSLVLLALVNCSSNGGESSGQTWWEWHAEKRAVDEIVIDAINEPGGGDYAKAADAIRNSNRPAMVKQFEIGSTIVDGILWNARTRPPGSLEQGLRMMEDATVPPGEMQRPGAQSLRMMFERGGNSKLPRGRFPVDRTVADCWLAIEEERAADPDRCIALRRQRLPNVGG